MEEETIRWPTNLDRAAIEKRRIEARKTAEKEGWADVAALLADVERKSAAEIAKAVTGALDWLHRHPEQHAFARQLQMVALNLKNLK